MNFAALKGICVNQIASHIPLTQKQILRFWSPLGITWLLMAVEGPIVAAIIARASEPKYNLAAYGIAFAFALLFEAPVIMLLSATVALVKDYASYLKMLSFTRILNVAVLCANTLALSPPIFKGILGLFRIPEEVQHLCYEALLILLPWPVAIGFRRFYQGVLIKYKQTKIVAAGTVIRLLFMFCALFAGSYYSSMAGVLVGATALSAGVVGECVFIFFASRTVIRALAKYERDKEPTGYTLTLGSIANFTCPLAMTSFLNLGVQPLVTFFVGISRLPVESLAVLPVINSFVFLFKCIGLSLQDVVIALLGERYQDYLTLRSFIFTLAGGLMIFLSALVISPLARIWLENISGLSPELSQFALGPLRVMTVIPPLTILLCWQRALAITRHKNVLITLGICAEVVCIVAVIGMCAYFDWVHGAYAACIALSLGRLASNCFLAAKRREFVFPKPVDKFFHGETVNA